MNLADMSDADLMSALGTQTPNPLSQQLQPYLNHPNVRNFLDIISKAEGTDKNGYQTAFGGGLIDNLNDHPRQLYDFTQTNGVKNKTSAAGRYQFIQPTWDDVSGKLGLKDFGPESQDLAALELIRRNGSLNDVLNGDYHSAVKKSGGTWASLPSSPYAQPKRTAGFIEGLVNSIVPTAQAQTMPDYSKLSNEEILSQLGMQQPTATEAQGNPDVSSMSDADLMKHLQGGNVVTDSAPGITVRYVDKSVPKVSSNPFVGVLMGLGYGVGQVGLGAQHWVGKGAKAIGLDQAGNWLINDAQQGRDRLAAEIKPYQDVSPFSTGAGTLAGNIAATWPVGGALGKLAGSAVPALSKVAPSAVPYAEKLANAIASGGMKLGGAPAASFMEGAANMGLRSLGGAINGAATAGLVDPEDWTSGAVIGAAAPPVISGAAYLGHKVGDKLGSNLATQLANYTRKEPLNNTIRQSVDAGYVIPPNMVNPSFKNQLIESISGKQASQQIASTKNNEVTGSLVRKALGIADDAPLNVSALENIRKDAGQAYSNISKLSDSAAKDLEVLKQARNDSQAWFKAYNRSASPDDLRKAKEFRALASEMESKLEQYASDAGRKELIPALRDARQQIAKSYTVERALKDASGNVDARVLARLYEKGAPLTEELLTVGKFGSAFPTIAKSPEQIGSPAAHNMKAIASALMGVSGASATGNPLGAAAAVVPFVTPPIARGLMFSNSAQKALIPNAPTAGYAQRLAELLQNPNAQMLIGKSAPIVSTLIGQQGAQ